MFGIQGAPIKKTIYNEKFIISVIVIDFVTRFAGFKDEDTGHIFSKCYYITLFNLKLTFI